MTTSFISSHGKLCQSYGQQCQQWQKLVDLWHKAGTLANIVPFLTEDDEQVLQVAVMFMPTATPVRFKTSDVAPIAMVSIKPIKTI